MIFQNKKSFSFQVKMEEKFPIISQSWGIIKTKFPEDEDGPERTVVRNDYDYSFWWVQEDYFYETGNTALCRYLNDRVGGASMTMYYPEKSPLAADDYRYIKKNEKYTIHAVDHFFLTKKAFDGFARLRLLLKTRRRKKRFIGDLSEFLIPDLKNLVREFIFTGNSIISPAKTSTFETIFCSTPF